METGTDYERTEDHIHEDLVFLNSVVFLPCPLSALNEAFGLTAASCRILTISILKKT